ncbi:RluA family pseudouridine synthase [Desulfomicrobium baculatum]|uniref:Pseudouridine synthase n=1 Tax=Desulfomicrobium baculatum (strain DSM 4028 / VKM B-1378 / X) TaxID=525897 RepID=C7LVL1_DESBD|nr:RluA family pseudouridine synthase [Desulfomicrobium baculatum]ACU89767.1 pseudouridine synthase [Desulfomicrobium baculatum DSM 4028]
MSLEPLRYDPPTEPRLAVIHEDRDMVVVNKPSGLLSVPGRTPELFDSVLSRVREIHRGAQAVHRLDLGTSGVLVVATRRKAETILRQQFQDRLTRKLYLARVQGVMSEDSGQVDLPLICDWPNRPMQMVCHDTGKPALTDYQVLESDGESTLVLLRPHTGRSHQLRVHMASLGHPILGDNLYGEQRPGERLLLHASQLGLYHPYSGEWTTFHAPCDFAEHIAPIVLKAPTLASP